MQKTDLELRITVYVVKSMLKNILRLFKKAQPKQSRMKSIIWYLRWLVRTRVNISLQPNGLIGPRTDIKLRQIGLVRSYKD